MAEDNRIKIRELPASELTHQDLLAVAKNNIEKTVHATIRDAVLAGLYLEAGTGIKIDSVKDPDGYKITGTAKYDDTDLIKRLDAMQVEIDNLKKRTGPQVFVQQAAPTSEQCKTGDLWWDLNTARLYVRYNHAWVQTNGGSTILTTTTETADPVQILPVEPMPLAGESYHNNNLQAGQVVPLLALNHDRYLGQGKWELNFRYSLALPAGRWFVNFIADDRRVAYGTDQGEVKHDWYVSVARVFEVPENHYLRLGNRNDEFPDATNTTVGYWLTTNPDPPTSLDDFTEFKTTSQGLDRAYNMQEVDLTKAGDGPAVLYQSNLETGGTPRRGLHNWMGYARNVSHTDSIGDVVTHVETESSSYWDGASSTYTAKVESRGIRSPTLPLPSNFAYRVSFAFSDFTPVINDGLAPEIVKIVYDMGGEEVIIEPDSNKQFSLHPNIMVGIIASQNHNLGNCKAEFEGIGKYSMVSGCSANYNRDDHPMTKTKIKRGYKFKGHDVTGDTYLDAQKYRAIASDGSIHMMTFSAPAFSYGYSGEYRVFKNPKGNVQLTLARA